MIEPLSIDFLLARGYCCGNICTNCPYTDSQGNRHISGVTTISKRWVIWKKQHPLGTYSEWKQHCDTLELS